MILKAVKIGVVAVTMVGLGSWAVFGTEAGSYVRTSVCQVHDAAKDKVPVEFELERARDLVDEIIPEMHANIRLIAQEEVEIARLEDEIVRSDESLGDEAQRIARLRDAMGVQQASYRFGGITYDRHEVKDELARRFERYKEAEVVLAGKKRLLETRKKSLMAAMRTLDETRARKARLEDQIATLQSQHRLIQAAARGSQLNVDNSKLAQTEKVIAEIRNRLEVAERTLAHEARFIDPIDVDPINETDLLAEVDQHFSDEGADLQAGPVAMGGTTDVSPAE